jgi:hypothetical protein
MTPDKRDPRNLSQAGGSGLVFLADGSIQFCDRDLAAISRIVDRYDRCHVKFQPINVLHKIGVVCGGGIGRRRVGLSGRIEGVRFDQNFLLGQISDDSLAENLST